MTAVKEDGMKRSLFYLSILCLVLSGCVTTGTYEQKVAEAQKLDKSLQEQRGQYELLAAENQQLKNQIAALAGDRNSLAADKRGLEESLKSTSDEKNQKIGELSQRLGELSQKIAGLEAENRGLTEEVARLQKQKEEEVQKTSSTYGQLLEQMKGEIAKGEVTISELKGKLTVNMVDSVLFDSGKSEVKANGLLVLQKVIDILKGNDKLVRIEGHTDNVQIGEVLARKYPTNWELSAARAINVTRYLQQQGLDTTRLSAVAYGEFKPVAPNDTDEGRAKNRRIEIVLVAKE